MNNLLQVVEQLVSNEEFIQKVEGLKLKKVNKKVSKKKS